MSKSEPNDIDTFVRTLPDPDGAVTFLSRMESQWPERARRYRREPLLLSRLLTIASYSPFLAEHLLRHPDDIGWLKREAERDLDKVKSNEQLSEELARFVTRSLESNPRTRLALFKQRELLRIYLRDCLGIATLTEVTEELSNLADVILDHSLGLAYQDSANLFGAPSTRDERGRIVPAEFAIVALGKLGCRELNYASDIDLFFLFLGAGETAGDGRRPDSVVNNREFFTSLAERVVQMIGSNAGEGPVYRIDLRLRPYGRDGDLVWEIKQAAEYYRNKAQGWERQALIRARASAGNERVVTEFLDLVRDDVFKIKALPDALRNVRRAKEKIDRQEAQRAGGYNVKLGRGGIREIEFIAQALQLLHGGREPWVRSAQTLIVLARLAEKNYISESERSSLSSAYSFLRTVEHRLQMEHGAQTHRLPVGRERLDLVARRCGYLNEPDPGASFLKDLRAHTASVRAIFDRVLGENSGESEPQPVAVQEAKESRLGDETGRLINHASKTLGNIVDAFDSANGKNARHRAAPRDSIKEMIMSALQLAINPARSLRNLEFWAGSLATYERDYAEAAGWIFSYSHSTTFLEKLLSLLSSPYLSHLMISRPSLASVLVEEKKTLTTKGFFEIMKASVLGSENPGSEADALRRSWHRQVIEIGSRDMMGARGRGPGAGSDSGHDLVNSASISNSDSNEKFITPGFTPAPYPRPPAPYLVRLRESNLEQTALAEATLHIATEIALKSLGIFGADTSKLPFAILALGRLGHSGMDHGSDMDLLIVYDDQAEWPPRIEGVDEKRSASVFGSPQEFFADLTTHLVRILSTVTREGFLYRVDLRLRPDGKSGPLAQGLSSLILYLSERASAWELSAYLKVREAAGNPEFGRRARTSICEAIFNSASRYDSLKEELSLMRARLEKEKASSNPRNIKWGRGGMTDVYFITRYLQLRDRISYPTERGTTRLIAHLGEVGSLDLESSSVLVEGYSFLRKIDHWIRLLLERPGPVFPDSNTAMRDIARALDVDSIARLEAEYSNHTATIRAIYDALFD